MTSTRFFEPILSKRLLLVVALALTVSALTSCSRGSANAKNEAPAVPVLVARAEARDIPVEIHTVGSVQAYSTVAIRSQITGQITKVHFQEGQEVKTGDMLFTIDPRPYQAALDQAMANLKRDEAQMLSADLSFQRTSNLFVSKIAAQQDYDTAQATYFSAEATVLADQAAITNAQVNLSFTAIRSPIEGRTVNLTVREGNIVKAPDDLILTITQVHPIYVGFSVPEQNLPAIRQRMDETSLLVTAAPPSVTDKAAQGTLTFIDNTVDTNTGTILLKATFPNTDNFLWPGQYVQTSLMLSNLVQATVVPSQAVQNSQNGEVVFVVKPDQTVETEPVSTGLDYKGFTVVTGNVKPGDTVVIDGQLRLVPGSKVSAKSEETAAVGNATVEHP